jgi:GWxTD domain-containing protein
LPAHNYPAKHSGKVQVDIQLLKLIFCCALISITFFNLSLCADSAGQKQTDLYVDYAVFRADTNLSYVDIYFAFERRQIQHLQTNEENFLTARYSVKLNVLRGDTAIYASEWNGNDRVESHRDVKPGQLISDICRLILSPAKFTVTIGITDLSNRKEIKKNLTIVARPFRQNSLTISDLSLALRIEKAAEVSKFTKSGFDVLPNPLGTYNLDWPVLYYYCEVYHLTAGSREKEKQTYTTTATVFDQYGRMVKQISQKTTPITNPDIVVMNKTLVSSLQSGAYQLRVSVVNHSTGESIERRKDFYVYRAADFVHSQATTPGAEDELRLLYLTKTEDELDAEFEKIAYIASASEKDVYERLDLHGKREFFTNFWQLKSSLEGKDKLSFRREFFDRVDHADTVYSMSGKDGWQTDRGRIVIKYGLPDDVEKFYGGSVTKPYEVWTYHGLEGGVIFVFLDVTGYGNYKLVHSTAREEIHDNEWQTRYGN